VTPVVESVRRMPAAVLRPYVAWYSGYRLAGLAPGRHRGLPSPYLTVILTLDDPLELDAHGSYDALVGGLHTVPELITHPGRQSGIQLALTPLGSRALLGVPAAAVAGLNLPASELWGPDADDVRERLLGSVSWEQRFVVLDAWLAGRITGASMPADLREAWRWIGATAGAEPVGALAGRLGWSRRHLLTRFRAETGVTPKVAARLVRFHRARLMLQRRVARGQVPALARVAAATGYVDQSHFTREFGQFAGCAPTRWIADEFPFVQAGDPAARAH
jgi:AraC-like DNA-binding protein